MKNGYRVSGIGYRARRAAGAPALSPCAHASARYPKPDTRYPIRHRRARGLSVVELLVSLAITAMLLTATMVAIDASFQAYAVAAESASTQTATRLVVHRVLALIRTSTVHGPLEPVANPAIPQAIKDFFPAGTTFDSPPAVTLVGDAIVSPYLEVVDQQGNLVRIQYLSKQKQLFAVVTPYGSTTPQAYPLLGGVTQATFHAVRRLDDQGVYVLQRATVDFTVEPDKDTSLAIEDGHTPPVRIVASTMPRKLE